MDNRIAVCDPVYPVYVDSNVMAGRTGEYDAKTETWSNVIYMPCTMENNFVPELPKETPDIIYLCLPNNPTGTTFQFLWNNRIAQTYSGKSSVFRKAQLKEQVAFYMNNAKIIKEGLKDAGYTVFGGVNAPYIWLQTPDKMPSWDFFDFLLKNANVVGTPGSGFGPSGEGYFRLTAFGSHENTLKAIERIKAL